MADEMDFESDLVLVNWASQEQESSVHPADAGDFDLAESALEESTLAREPSLENETEGEAEEMTNPLTLQNSAKEEDEQEPLEDDEPGFLLQDPSMTPKLKEGAEQEDEASWSSKAKFYRVELGKLGAFLARPWAATEAHKGGMPASDWPHLFLSLPRWEDVLFSIFLMSSLAYVSARIILKSTRIEDSKNVVLPQPPPDSPQTSFVTVIHVPTPTSDIFLVIRPTPSCTDAPSRYLRHNEDVLVKKANQIVGRIGTALSLSPRATEILEKWAVWGIYMFRASLKLSRKVIGKSQRLAKHRLKMWQARFRARDWRRD